MAEADGRTDAGEPTVLQGEEKGQTPEERPVPRESASRFDSSEVSDKPLVNEDGSTNFIDAHGRKEQAEAVVGPLKVLANNPNLVEHHPIFDDPEAFPIGIPPLHSDDVQVKKFHDLVKKYNPADEEQDKKDAEAHEALIDEPRGAVVGEPTPDNESEEKAPS